MSCSSGNSCGSRSGKHSFDLLIKIHPFVLAPEVIYHQESSVIQVPSQTQDFLGTEQQIPGFHNIDEGVLEELWIRSDRE